MIRIISAFLNVAGNFFQMRSSKVVRVSSESTHRVTCITVPLGVHNSSDRQESFFIIIIIFFFQFPAASIVLLRPSSL